MPVVMEQYQGAGFIDQCSKCEFKVQFCQSNVEMAESDVAGHHWTDAPLAAHWMNLSLSLGG